MPNREDIVFDGVRYYRYPDSPRPSARTYFQRGGKMLHRAIWEHAHGPIPPGHEIHHVDHDPLNNDLANLECAGRSEHRRESQAHRRLHDYVCALCGAPFRAYQASLSPQRFCCKQHKQKFHNDLRAWREREARRL